MISKKEYEVALLEHSLASPVMIISRELDDEIAKRMATVIKTEAPIREQLLFKRVINSFGLQKLGSRLLPVFKEISNTLEFEYTEENNEKLYHYGEENYFRPTPDSQLRYSYQIPFEEGANCILYIMENSEVLSYSKSKLKKLFLQAMEYQKCGAKVEELFIFALKDPRIKISGNGRILK